MKRNMGATDRLIRLIVAIVLIILFYKGIVVGTLGIIALIVALLLTVTSLISFCPLYTVLGMNTCKKDDEK